MVQSNQSDSCQDMPSGMSHGTGTNLRFSDCGGQRLKPFGFSLALTASLKRSPDTNQFSPKGILSQEGVHRT